MTPLAMKVLKHLISIGDRQVARMLAAAPTFDTTDVNDLVTATVCELMGTLTEAGSDKPLMEHGGLLIAPADYTWLEARIDGGRFGALIHAVEDQLCFFAYQGRTAGRDITDVEMLTQGFIELQPGDEHFSVHLDVRWPDQSVRQVEGTAQYGVWLATCLLLINAPRGVERRSAQPHKGLARQVRAAGLGQLQNMHTVRLSLTAGDVGEPGEGGAGSPKAFHFCRSHLRRLPGGGQTRVRAHWRGDPALGINSPTYRVAA